jgi:hypothetical protein
MGVVAEDMKDRSHLSRYEYTKFPPLHDLPVTHAPPQLGYMMGWSLQRVTAYAERAGWRYVLYPPDITEPTPLGRLIYCRKEDLYVVR